MSSRAGPRAAGTDGTDYSHREIIKEQYYIRSGRFSPESRRRKSGYVCNTDPGVMDDEEEDAELQRVADGGDGGTSGQYEDQEVFFRELRESQQREAATNGGQKQERANFNVDLPLAGDYHGMGGPETVPLQTPGAFEKPWTVPHKTCLLDELYLAPTPEQIRAFRKIEILKENAQNKSRLKWSVMCHFLLSLLVLAKLTPEILDKLDIFVMELEELFIPKSRPWEWLWLSSSLFTMFGLGACKKSNMSYMTKFAVGIALFGLGPILFGFAVYFQDVYTYVSTKEAKGLDLWKGYPVAVIWYVFFIVATQVHVFELSFAYTLLKVWNPKKKRQ